MLMLVALVELAYSSGRAADDAAAVAGDAPMVPGRAAELVASAVGVRALSGVLVAVRVLVRRGA